MLSVKFTKFVLALVPAAPNVLFREILASWVLASPLFVLPTCFVVNFLTYADHFDVDLGPVIYHVFRSGDAAIALD